MSYFKDLSGQDYAERDNKEYLSDDELEQFIAEQSFGYDDEQELYLGVD